MKVIWYFLDCCGENEELIVKLCKAVVPECTDLSVRVIKYQRLLRFQGEWNRVDRNLFPGFVLVECSDEKVARWMQKQIFSQIDDKKQNGNLIQISQNMMNMLQQLCSSANVINLSSGYIRNGHLIVTDGPLKGWERNVRKIDRHKRLAWLDISENSEAGILPEVTVGLEVVQKTA